MVKKIENIANFGVFNNFNWDASVIKNNTPIEFKKVNILYGRNYSGKTTLSRIFRAFETNRMPTHFENGTFSLLIDSNQIINQSDINTNQLDIHVFNEDFIKSNLSFFSDPEKPIESFTLLGEENIEIENKIKQLEDILGSNEDNGMSGLYLKYSREKEDLDKKMRALKTKENGLEILLGKKATGGENSIKQRHNEFGDINYNIGKLTKIPTVQKIDTRIIAKPWIMLYEKYGINYYLDLLLDINGIRYVTDLTPNDEIYMPSQEDIEGFVTNKLVGTET
jgi:wobble nucleotide-excising tRNase